MNEIDVFNIADESKKISLNQRQQRNKELEDIRSILKTPAGRRYFWRKMGEFGIFRNSFTPNSSQTSFNEGLRNAGLSLLIDMNEADVSAFAKAQNEYLSALNSKKEASNA